MRLPLLHIVSLPQLNEGDQLVRQAALRGVEALKKAEGRRQKAEGNPIDKSRGFNNDALYLVASHLGRNLFWFSMNKFTLLISLCRKASFSSSLLPSAFCLPTESVTPEVSEMDCLKLREILQRGTMVQQYIDAIAHKG